MHVPRVHERIVGWCAHTQREEPRQARQPVQHRDRQTDSLPACSVNRHSMAGHERCTDRISGGRAPLQIGRTVGQRLGCRRDRLGGIRMALLESRGGRRMQVNHHGRPSNTRPVSVQSRPRGNRRRNAHRAEGVRDASAVLADSHAPGRGRGLRLRVDRVARAGQGILHLAEHIALERVGCVALGQRRRGGVQVAEAGRQGLRGVQGAS